MFPLDVHGRVIGGLLQACNASNNLHKLNRVDYRYSQALATHGKSLQGTELMLHGNVLCPTVRLLQPTSNPNIMFGPIPINRANGIAAAVAPNRVDSEEATEKKRRKRGPNKVKDKDKIGDAGLILGSDDREIAITKDDVAPSEKIEAAIVEEDVEEQAATAQLSSSKRSKQGVEQYCVCKSPWVEGRFMIGCDGECKGWFHPECLGYSTGGKQTALLDMDGVKASNLNNYSFFCPKCELVRGGSGEAERKYSASSRFFRWCDVVDISDAADANEEVKDKEKEKEKENLPATRWKHLEEARQLALAIQICKVCRRSHHPVLPCAVSRNSDGSWTPPVKIESEAEVPEDSALPLKLSQSPNADTWGLIVAGKYQGLSGQVSVQSAARRIVQLILADSDKTRVIVPSSYVLLSRSKPFDTAQTMTGNWKGVEQSVKGGYLAYLDLSDKDRVYMGRFVSRLRAARAHDVAMRLQYGDDGLIYTELNFPDLGRLVGALAGSKRQHPGNWEQTMALVQQSSNGPFKPSQFMSFDALQAVEWADAISSAFDLMPPYIELAQGRVELVRIAASPHAEEVSTKLGQWLSSQNVGSNDAGEVDEDEMDVIMKKYSRNRSVRQRPRQNN